MRTGQTHPNLSADRAEIHLNDSAFHSHREWTQSINYVWLKKKKECKKGKAPKKQTKKKNQERNCNSWPESHLTSNFIHYVSVYVSVFFYLQPLQTAEVTKYSCFQRHNSILTQKTAKKQERDGMRQREREGHVNRGLMFKWVLLRVITKTICCMTITAVLPFFLSLFPPSRCLINVSIMLISYAYIEADLCK